MLFYEYKTASSFSFGRLIKKIEYLLKLYEKKIKQYYIDLEKIKNNESNSEKILELNKKILASLEEIKEAKNKF